MPWYHFPDPADAPVTRIRPLVGGPFRSTQGVPVAICLDPEGEHLAPITDLEGDAIGSEVVVGDSSLIPRFRGPEGVTLLWAKVEGHHPLPIRADFSEQIEERVRPRATPSEARPDASAVAVGTPWFDTVVHQTVWSDGEVWRRADGTDAAVPPPTQNWETPAGATEKADLAASNMMSGHTTHPDPHGDRAFASGLVASLAESFGEGTPRLHTVDGGGVEDEGDTIIIDGGGVV